MIELLLATREKDCWAWEMATSRINEASPITSANRPAKRHVMCSYQSAKGFKLPSLVGATPEAT